MASTTNIKIELPAGDHAEILHALKALLDNNPHISTQVKLKEGVPGQMSIAEHLLEITLHAGATLTLEGIYHHYIHPAIKKVLEKRAGQKSLGGDIRATLQRDHEKLHASELENGEVVMHTHEYLMDKSRTWAVLIGNGVFNGRFGDIDPVANNLEALKQVLINEEGIGIPGGQIVTLQEESALEIQRTLIRISKQPGIETLLIYFVGHGYRTGINELKLLTAEAEKVDDEVVGGIDYDYIAERILKASPAKQKIVILDACYSGIATQNDEGAQDFPDVIGTYVMSSSGAGNASYFKQGGNSTYFTGMLLDVLNKGVSGAGKKLSLENIYQYIRQQAKEIKNCPLPTAKNNLNIPASKFLLGPNPSFSYTRALAEADRALAAQNYAYALSLYEQLFESSQDTDILEKMKLCRQQVKTPTLKMPAKKTNWFSFAKFILVAMAGLLVFLLSKTFSTNKKAPQEPDQAAMQQAIDSITGNLVHVEDTALVIGGSDSRPGYFGIAESFRIMKKELTIGQWETIMNEEYKGDNGKCKDCPVFLDLDKIRKFIQLLNLKTGRNFRLPNEIEWTIAAGGGQQSRHYNFSGSDDADEVAWYSLLDGNVTLSEEEMKDNYQARRVGTKLPNELGIFDMSGNADELVTVNTNPALIRYTSKGGAYTMTKQSCRIKAATNLLSDYELTGGSLSGNNKVFGVRLCLPYGEGKKLEPSYDSAYAKKNYHYAMSALRGGLHDTALYFLDKVKYFNDPDIWYEYAMLITNFGHHDSIGKARYILKAAYAGHEEAGRHLGYLYGKGFTYLIRQNKDSAAFYQRKVPVKKVKYSQIDRGV